MGTVAGLEKSWSLVSGRWCYVFGAHFAVLPGLYAVTHIWIALLAPPLFTFWGAIVFAIPAILAAPILASLVTVVYMSLRVEKDGINAPMLAVELGEEEDITESEMVESTEPVVLVTEEIV